MSFTPSDRCKTHHHEHVYKREERNTKNSKRRGPIHFILAFFSSVSLSFSFSLTVHAFFPLATPNTPIPPRTISFPSYPPRAPAFPRFLLLLPVPAPPHHAHPRSPRPRPRPHPLQTRSSHTRQSPSAGASSAPSRSPAGCATRGGSWRPSSRPKWPPPWPCTPVFWLLVLFFGWWWVGWAERVKGRTMSGVGGHEMCD